MLSLLATLATPPPSAHILLHAPFTPFTAAGAVDVSVVPSLAKQAAAFGVNTVWAPGGMGQFDTLTIAERKALVEAWSAACKTEGIYFIAHVGTTVVGEAIELAKHAAAAGADAIASVPPYYETTSDADTIVDWLEPICDAAPGLPLYYYHIPGSTRCTVKATDLLAAAAAPRNATSSAPRLPALAGIKYVSDDLWDWFEAVRRFNSTHSLLFAPEPKLASFSLAPGHGVILAEDYFAQTYARMRAAYLRGDAAAAAEEQEWKRNVSEAIGAAGSAAGRTLYRKFPLTSHLGDPLGPPRLPQRPLSDESWRALQPKLDALDFWKRAAP